ncbi:MAG: apolipoprotein N-acyltransferase, partial [Bdellovibrionales bacterium]|nr:apolipoprotein N-acyltransferase [Bdellovibrionales bacterium]
MWTGWLAQFTLTLIGFNWIAHTIYEFGHLPLPIAYLGLSVFCSFASLHIPFAGLLWFGLRRKFNLTATQGIFLIPTLTWLVEQLYPMIFDWHLGYTWLWAQFPAYHVAEWIGFSGLSLLTYLAHIPIMIAIFVPWKQKLQWIAIPIFAFAVLTGAGKYLLNCLPPFDRSATVLVVQGNIGNLEKQYAEKGTAFRDSIIQTYFKVTLDGLKEGPVDFALWPETAFPDQIHPLQVTSQYVYQLRSFLSQHQLRLLTGGYGLRLETNQDSNSLFFMAPRGMEEDPPPYDKTILLAFGEYLPGANWFPKLRQWLPQVGNFARGTGPKTRNFDGIRIGPQICYEGLFDWFTRKLAQDQAQIVVNVTNDSWYGTWQQPYQHLYMTLARAIEVRRPLVRATNTGFSTAIQPNGEILAFSPFNQEWSGRYTLKFWENGPIT